MTRLLTSCMVAATLAGVAAGCADDDAPTFPVAPELDFTITAATEIPDKGVIPVAVRLTRARFVQFPLTFTFEKENLDEPSLVIAERSIDEPGDGEITIQVDVRKDPIIRVTVTEAGSRGISVSKALQIDVLTFP